MVLFNVSCLFCAFVFVQGAAGGAGAVAGPPAEADFTSTLAVDVAVTAPAQVQSAPTASHVAALEPLKPAADTAVVPVAAPAAAPAAPKAKAAPAEYEATEHKLSLADLAAHPDFVASRINPTMPSASLGLTSAEAAARLAAHGRNELTPPKETPEIIKFLKCYTDPVRSFLYTLMPRLLFGAVCSAVQSLNAHFTASLTSSAASMLPCRALFMLLLLLPPAVPADAVLRRRAVHPGVRSARLGPEQPGPRHRPLRREFRSVGVTFYRLAAATL